MGWQPEPLGLQERLRQRVLPPRRTDPDRRTPAYPWRQAGSCPPSWPHRGIRQPHSAAICRVGNRPPCCHAPFWLPLQPPWPWHRQTAAAAWPRRASSSRSSRRIQRSMSLPGRLAMTVISCSSRFGLAVEWGRDLPAGQSPARHAAGDIRPGAPVAGAERCAGIFPAFTSSYQSSWCSAAQASSTCPVRIAE